jgi:hypothetical protein
LSGAPNLLVHYAQSYKKKVQASPTGDSVTPELVQNYEKIDFLANYPPNFPEILTEPLTSEN